MREVIAGNREQARADAVAALKLDRNRLVRARSALVLAQAGDTALAEKFAEEIERERPVGTSAQHYWLPAIRAAVALEQKDASRAVELLSKVGTEELSPDDLYLYPAYLRGEAYLMLGDGTAAAKEFHKFIDHYGLVGNAPWGALARLGLARAYALEAQTDPCCSGESPHRVSETSSRCGKMPILIFLSTSKRKRNTQSCGRQV